MLREWEVLRERLSRIAAERVTAAGELFRAAELTLAVEESAAHRAYRWALEAYEAAGRLLDQSMTDPHTDLPDLAAAVVLAEQAVERLAAAHALHTGARPEPAAIRCFYNPLHGPAATTRPLRQAGKRRQRPTHTAREAAADRRPACLTCRHAILAGQLPDVLPALLPEKATERGTGPLLVPYYSVPQQWSPWSATACGAYDPDTPALVLRGAHYRHPPQ
ncbi:hypothetical protein PUR71_04010 [Streptomyces sp. SP17BM10]|uniref:hypothetical protein n=1 Tax=Streptomyces sp. SP17BM10 TaxID=3002530 RepID=UPI002E760270|nr:hypothetical protein [Streptomyces sp. SP17BM10]MEE1782100.1 hypothetical protein [Streptomyces sp. SP17BM10]